MAPRTSPAEYVDLPWGRARIIELVNVATPHHHPSIELLEFEDGHRALRFAAYHEGKPIAVLSSYFPGAAILLVLLLLLPRGLAGQGTEPILGEVEERQIYAEIRPMLESDEAARKYVTKCTSDARATGLSTWDWHNIVMMAASRDTATANFYALRLSSGGLRYIWRKQQELARDKHQSIPGTVSQPIAVASPEFDEHGLDRHGFDRSGYDRDGFDRSGFDREGFDRSGYDRDRFDRNGIDSQGFGRDGYNAGGRDMWGFGRDGYDADGRDRGGFDRKGWSKDGYFRDGFNAQGRDRRGFDRQGFDAGRDRGGFDRDGFDATGFDRQGFDRLGFDKHGFNRDGFDKQGFDRDGYDVESFDQNGFDRQGRGRDGSDLMPKGALARILYYGRYEGIRLDGKLYGVGDALPPHGAILERIGSVAIGVKYKGKLYIREKR